MTLLVTREALSPPSLTDLAITKSFSASPVEFNSPFTYTLLVANNGPSDTTAKKLHRASSPRRRPMTNSPSSRFWRA
jgi:hypothetical protein